jgi:hypothetical protein
MSTLTTPTALRQRTITYGAVVSAVLIVAFSLSVVHTVYAWVSGLEDPDFTVTTPLAWGFYAVAFGMALLARRDRSWAVWTVVAYLVVLLGIAVFYYPVTFTAEKQTVFGWFENDVYVGLLVTAFVLQVLRLRGVSLVTRR